MATITQRLQDIEVMPDVTMSVMKILITLKSVTQLVAIDYSHLAKLRQYSN